MEGTKGEGKKGEKGGREVEGKKGEGKGAMIENQYFRNILFTSAMGIAWTKECQVSIFVILHDTSSIFARLCKKNFLYTFPSCRTLPIASSNMPNYALPILPSSSLIFSLHSL